MNLLDAALAFRQAGCSVVPAAADGSKKPAGRWQAYQAERPDVPQLSAWLGDDTYDGFGVVCGAVSGSLEMLELEGRAVEAGLHVTYRQALADHGLGELWQRISTGYAETSPSGGVHVLYRVDGDPRPNTKLARRPATAAELASNPDERVKVLIETRGEGGFVIVAPSGGRTHNTGKPWQLLRGGPSAIATVTEDERDALHAIASLFDEMPVRQLQLPHTAGGVQDGRPGDDFNARATWQEILTPHGWRPVRRLGDTAVGWCRPGKDGAAISATTREAGGLYVFSTSTAFESETPYSKFGAYALLCHDGDYAAAAGQLRHDGYGTPRERDDDGIGDLIAAPSQPASVAAAKEPAGPRVVRLADVEPERIEWLWDGYLPLGKVVVLDGDPGVGKSTVSLDIGARTSTGSPMPDGTPAGAKGSVLVLSAEDGLADTIRPRLDAAGADPASVITITDMTYGTADSMTSRPVSIPGDLPAIEHVIAGHGVRLVIVDVLMAYLSADVNAHRDQDVRRALHVLSGLAERTRCCVIVLRHLNKSGGGNAIYRGGGSIGIIGAARAGFMCGRDPDDESGHLRVFASIKMNIAAEPPALGYKLVPDDLHGCGRIEWLGQVDRSAIDLLSEPEPVTARDEKSRAQDYLRTALASGPRPSRDVEEEAREIHDISQRTLKRARAQLKIAAVKRAGGWWISLPEHEGDLNDAN